MLGGARGWRGVIAARSTVDCCGRRRHNPPPAAYTAAAVGAA
jgi:hypothetical protein